MDLKVTEKLFQNNHLNIINDACSTENKNEVQ